MFPMLIPQIPRIDATEDQARNNDAGQRLEHVTVIWMWVEFSYYIESRRQRSVKISISSFYSSRWLYLPLVAAAWAFTAARSRLKAVSALPTSFDELAGLEANRRWRVVRRVGDRNCCAKRRPTRWKDIVIDEESGVEKRRAREQSSYWNSRFCLKLLAESFGHVLAIIPLLDVTCIHFSIQSSPCLLLLLLPPSCQK